MPKLTYENVAHDLGEVSSALHASAESVITKQLESIKQQLMEMREVSIGTLLGMADTVHSLSWSDLGKVLSANLKQVTSNILQVTLGASSSFVDDQGNLDYGSMLQTYLTSTLKDTTLNNPEFGQTLVQLNTVQALTDVLSQGLALYNNVKAISEKVEPYFPIAEITASFASAFMSGGGTAPQGASQASQLAMNYIKQLAAVLVHPLKEKIFDYKIKVPRILLDFSNVYTSREAYQVWAESLELYSTEDPDKTYEEIKKFLSDDFYSSTMNNLEWWNRVSGTIKKIDKNLQDISVSNQFANIMMADIVNKSLGISGVDIPDTSNWMWAYRSSSDSSSINAAMAPVMDYVISVDEDDIVFMSKELVDAEDDFTSFYTSKQLNKMIIDGMSQDGLICDSLRKTYDEEESEKNPTGSRKLFNTYNKLITDYHSLLSSLYGEVRANVTESLPVIDYQHPEYTGWRYSYLDSASGESVNDVESSYKYKNIVKITSNGKSDLELLKNNDPSIINRALCFDTMAQHFWNTDSAVGSSDPNLQVSIPEITLEESSDLDKDFKFWLDDLSRFENIADADITASGDNYDNDATFSTSGRGKARKGWVKKLIYAVINAFRKQALKDGQNNAAKAVFAATGNVISFEDLEDASIASVLSSNGTLESIIDSNDDDAKKVLAKLVGPGDYGLASGLLVGRFCSPAVYDPTSPGGSKVKLWRFESTGTEHKGTLYNKDHLLYADADNNITKQVIPTPLTVVGKGLPSTPRELAVALSSKGLFGGNQATCIAEMQKIAGDVDKAYEGVASILYDELSLRLQEKALTIFKTVDEGWSNFPLVSLSDVTCNALRGRQGVNRSLYGLDTLKNGSSSSIDACLEYWDYIYSARTFHYSPDVEGSPNNSKYYRSSYLYGSSRLLSEGSEPEESELPVKRASHKEDTVVRRTSKSENSSFSTWWRFTTPYHKVTANNKTLAHYSLSASKDSSGKNGNHNRHWDIKVDFLTPWGLLGSAISGKQGDATLFYPEGSGYSFPFSSYIAASNDVYLLSKKSLPFATSGPRSTCYFYNKNHEVVLFKVSAIHSYAKGFSSINSVDITLESLPGVRETWRAVGPVSGSHSQDYGSHIHSISRNFRGYAGPTYVYKLSPLSDAPEGETALVKTYYGESIPLPSFDTVSYPQSYFEKTFLGIRASDLSRLAGSFILPGIPKASNYSAYSLKNSGYNLIGIQKLLDSYTNAIKGPISSTLNQWPAISGWKFSSESLSSCKATDVMLKDLYKVTDSLYNVKSPLGSICKQGAFASLGNAIGQNPYDYDLRGLFRMMDPIRRVGVGVKEIFSASSNSFSRSSCQKLDHLMGLQPWLSIAETYNADPSSPYCGRFEATYSNNKYYYRNFEGNSVEILYPERVVPDSSSSTGLYYYAVDITKDCLFNFKKFIINRLEGDSEVAGIQYYEGGEKKFDKNSLYYKRYLALNSRMSRPQGSASSPAFFIANKNLINSGDDYSKNKLEEYREILEAIPVARMDEYAYIPSQEATGSQLEIRGTAFDSSGLTAAKEGSSLQIGKFYNKSLMEEIRSRIHDKCVLVCAPCPVKNSCPFYDETEVLKKYVPEVTTIDFYVKDNTVDFLDYTSEGGLESVRNSQGNIINVGELEKQSKKYSDIVMDPESERDLEEIREALGSTVLGYKKDEKYADELGWLQGGRWGSLTQGVDESGNPSKDAKDYKYLYDAVFLNDEESYVDYGLSSNEYPVGVNYKGDYYSGNIKIKVPTSLKIFNDASLNPASTKVYLISDDTKDSDGNDIKPIIYLNTLDSLKYSFDLTDDGNPEGSQSSNDARVYAKDVAQASLNTIKGFESDRDQIWQESIRKTISNPASGTSNFTQTISIKGRDRINSGKAEVVGDVSNLNESEVLRGKPYVISYVNFLRKVRIDMSTVRWADSKDPADVERARQTLPFMKTNVRLAVVKATIRS